jgi:murein DD-endopeptidase MepM/ murein hydrolase activator NlpD
VSLATRAHRQEAKPLVPFEFRRTHLFAVFGAVAALATGFGLAESSADVGRAGLPTRLVPGVAPALVLPAAPRPARVAHVHPVEARVDYGEAAARFGNNRGDHVHEGQDVFAPTGTPVVAVADGIVLESGGGDARGNYVAIYEPRARRTYVYLHMEQAPLVKPGQHVRAGQRVGHLGCTGSCFGPHLHFEVRLGRGSQRHAIDPLPLLRRWPRV